MGNLARGLSAVAARLDPKEAAEAAAALTQTLSKTTDPNATIYLARGLSAVAARLEPKEAAEAAAALIQDLSKTTNPYTNSLAKSLSAVLSPQESAATQKQLPGVTATVAALGGPVPPLAALASAQLAMEPLPPPLPPQTLVDLLKHPLCVGETRRLVLEQLGRRYHRPFADPWEFVDYVPPKQARPRSHHAARTAPRLVTVEDNASFWLRGRFALSKPWRAAGVSRPVLRSALNASAVPRRYPTPAGLRRPLAEDFDKAKPLLTLFQGAHPKRLRGADADAQGTRHAVQRPRHPRGRAVHGQAACRADRNAVGAAGAARLVQYGQFGVHPFTDSSFSPIRPATISAKRSRGCGGKRT